MSSYTDLSFHIHPQPELSSAIDPRITYTEQHGPPCIPVSVHNAIGALNYADEHSFTERLSQLLGTCMPQFIPGIEQVTLPNSAISHSPTSTISDSSDTYAYQDPPYLSLLNPADLSLASPTTPSMLSVASQYDDSQIFSSYSTVRNSFRRRRDAVFVAREYFEAMIAARSTHSPEDIANCGLPGHALSDASITAFDANSLTMEVTNAYHDDEKENYPKGYGSEINTILYGWLLKHTNNPYPSLNDKKILMQKTGLTKMQLKNWFCNMRRRKLKDTIRRTKKRSKF